MRRWLNLPAVLIPLTLCAAFVALAACKAPDGAGRATQTANNRSNAAGAASPPAAANEQARTAATPADDVRRISVADAHKEVQAGRAVFVDVRTKTEFDRGHIKGALSLPKPEIPARLAEVPRDKTLIIYCA